MTSLDLTRQESWRGSYYELAIELSCPKDSSRLLRALATLWSDPRLKGPWSKQSAIGSDAVERPQLLGDMFAFYGVLDLPRTESVGVVTWAIREAAANGSDWLDVCVPSAMLEPFGAGYPLDSTADPVLGSLDDLFLGLADEVYPEVPFDLALVGEEASGRTSAEQISTDWVAQRGGCLLSPVLRPRLGLQIPAVQRPSGLWWVPFPDLEQRSRAQSGFSDQPGVTRGVLV